MVMCSVESFRYGRKVTADRFSLYVLAQNGMRFGPKQNTFWAKTEYVLAQNISQQNYFTCMTRYLLVLQKRAASMMCSSYSLFSFFSSV